MFYVIFIKLYILKGKHNRRTKSFSYKGDKRAWTWVGEDGKANRVFIIARVCFCVHLSTGETKEMNTNSEHKTLELLFMFGWWEHFVLLDIQTFY